MTSKTNHNVARVLAYQYDANQRLTNRWRAAKQNTGYTRDPVGNVTKLTYPASPAITNRYDALNRLTNMVDGAGTTQFGYTSNGDLLSEDGPWANDTVTYSYHGSAPHVRTGLGLLQPNATAWGQSYGYDAADRLTRVVSPAGAFRYQFSLAGTVWTNLALPPSGSRVARTFDNVSRLTATRLLNGAGATLNYHGYTNNVGNQRITQMRVDNSYVTYDYDADGQLKAASGHDGFLGVPRMHEQFGYGYDAAGNLRYRTNNALVQTITPDGLNQLSTITRSGTYTVVGTTTGAATSVTVNGASAAPYLDNTFAIGALPLTNGLNSFTAIAQDNSNQRTTNTLSVYTPQPVSFQYDANGDMINDGRRAFSYDDENQLTQVTIGTTYRAEFVYDGLGRRRIKRDCLLLNGY